MASLTNILGGPWSPPSERLPDPPETQLHDAMLSAGLTPPEQILMDGKIHRFRSGTKGKGGSGDKTGWYVAYSDGVPAGRFGCWRAGVEVTFRADVGRSLTPADEMAIARRISEAKAIREAEQAKQREIASSTVESIWIGAQAASAEHPYLMAKGVQPHGARITGDGRLMVPLYDESGQLSSIQYIGHNGDKKYHPGAATSRTFTILGSMDDEPGPIYIAEGFATAATIHEVSGRPCVVAYSAGNLPAVTEIIRQKYGTAQDIVIVADNDASDVGRRYAEQACAKHGARYVLPPIDGDANDYHRKGHDLLSLLQPPSDDWLVHADEFSKQPAPIKWLVKHWIQSDALVMIHGPSGGGKTFLTLDMALRIASRKQEWFGHKVRHGTVVYLAGEGHHGLRSRIAAWKQHNGVSSVDMWLSREGCNLNTAEGYRRVVEHLRALKNPPKLVIVDTLHRFLDGDENSAQDAKTMLDACGAIMREFGCTVILVHHTGVNEEAQHRARGSSAWRGALDIEISVVPPRNENDPIQVIQRKSKDAEMAKAECAELMSVEIEGWIDEDGQPVTSAVLVQSDATVSERPKKPNKLDAHRKTFERAWYGKGGEIREGMPYISSSAFVDFLVENLGIQRSSAKTYVKPSSAGRVICELLTCGIIDTYENGWIVLDQVMASSMTMSKNDQ